MAAADGDHPAVAQRLLAAGAHAEMRDQDGDTALQIAQRRDHVACCAIINEHVRRDVVRQRRHRLTIMASCIAVVAVVAYLCNIGKTGQLLPPRIPEYAWSNLSGLANKFTSLMFRCAELTL